MSAALTPDEWELINALREIPDGPMRPVLTTLIGGLIDFARSPSCPEMQADGAPCTSLGRDCERCRHALAVLEDLRRQVPL